MMKIIFVCITRTLRLFHPVSKNPETAAPRWLAALPCTLRACRSSERSILAAAPALIEPAMRFRFRLSMQAEKVFSR
jgi:hypothetical protein